MDPLIWPSKCRTTSSNLHAAALWGYGIKAWGPTRSDEWYGGSGQRESAISVLAARHDDDDDDTIHYGERNWQQIILPRCINNTHGSWIQVISISKTNLHRTILKQNFIAYCSSKVPDCIFEINQLWQSGFSRVFSSSCCSCSFEPEIIKIGQSSYTMYSNNLLNFQESTTIVNAHTKNPVNFIVCPSYYNLIVCRLYYFLKTGQRSFVCALLNSFKYWNGKINNSFQYGLIVGIQLNRFKHCYRILIIQFNLIFDNNNLIWFVCKQLNSFKYIKWSYISVI